MCSTAATVFFAELYCASLPHRYAFQELYEKSTIYDDMVERHQKQLEAKQEEMDQEVEACNRIYQTRLAEIEAAQEAKWQNLVRSCYKQFEVA